VQSANGTIAAMPHTVCRYANRMGSRSQAVARGTYESVTDFAKIMHYLSIISLLSQRSFSLRSHHHRRRHHHHHHHHHHHCRHLLLIFHYLSLFISRAYILQQQRSRNRARKGKKENKKNERVMYV
jgi:hypothetical protein